MAQGVARIDRPIFVGGMARSGSAIFYNTLARHPDLAWLSRASKKFPRSLFLSRLVMIVNRDRRTSEGQRIWRRLGRPEDDFLGREHATPWRTRYLHDLVRAQTRLAGKPRFLNKHSMNALKMGFLDAVFPDALFVHLIRDARAVVRSLLDVKETYLGSRHVFWGPRPPGWREIEGRDPVEAGALQWKLTTEQALRDGARLGPSRYLEIRYEEFCVQPARTLAKLGDWAGLRWPDGMLEEATAGIRSQNYKWPEFFRPEELAAIESLTGDLLCELGYPVGSRDTRCAEPA